MKNTPRILNILQKTKNPWNIDFFSFYWLPFCRPIHQWKNKNEMYVSALEVEVLHCTKNCIFFQILNHWVGNHINSLKKWYILEPNDLFFFQRCARMHCTFTPQRAKNGKILQEIYLLPQITKNRSAPKEFEGKKKQLNFFNILVH